MISREIWRAAFERALKTFAQALLSTPAGLVLVNLVADIGDGNLDLVLLQKLGLLLITALTVATIAAGGSILTSIVNARNDGNPSANNAEVLPRRAIVPNP
jgi:hypothetical protein